MMLSKLSLSARSTAAMFSITRLVCALTSPGTISPVSGSSGIWPEQKTRLPIRMACEYGPTASWKEDLAKLPTPEEQWKRLDEILPEAFAVVKNAARRLTERGHTFTVCDQPMKWEMVHFDVQLIGGVVLHRGKISEMATGEGKTLVATLPLYLNALTGRGAHLVTVNDYLARRDAEWMGQLYGFLGLTVGCIQHDQG